MRASSHAVLLGVLAGCWATPRPAAPPRDVSVTFAVEHAELANGLELVVVPEPTATEVSVTMRFAVGSIDDPVGREGLAHLVEHLMFEHQRDGEALFDFLERSALGFSGFTTATSTVYSQHAPPAQLRAMLDVEVARIQQRCSEIPEASFVRQREIVRNELREREDADSVRVALHAGVYSAAHPLGRAHGTAASVAALTRDEACTFAAAHYVPSNAVVVVSGPVEMREVRAVVEATLGGVPRGTAVRSRPLPAAAVRHSISIDAPVERPWFVLAWPLPATSVERARVRAAASMVVTLVSARINGVVTLIELGAGAAREIAIAVAPSSEISFADALDSTKDAIARIGPWFGSGLYEHARNRAVYRLAASLDHSVERDVALADEVAEGGDVRTSSTAALRAVLAMSRDQARDLVRSALGHDKATVVTLRPSKHGAVSAGLAPTFRELRRRKVEDPEEALRAARAPVVTEPLSRARARTLSNGLGVVLLPLATMPTVDIRLVLPAGSGDEPAGQRGIAKIAAEAIQAPFDTTMFRFAQAGGRVDEEVGYDHTELSVHGLAAHLDILLSGLATTVREGAYDLDDVRDAVTWQRLTAGSDVRDRVAVAAWRDALYGPDHPYRYAGQWAHSERGAAELSALERFRAARYVPAGATLIIAGNFDVTTADRWVDYYFNDWTGSRLARRDRKASPRALAFAQRRDDTQLSLQIAFAAPTHDDVTLHVVAGMIDEALSDVREQIAASYGLGVRVVRRRLVTTIEIGGFIDASRAGDAFALLRDRLVQLGEASDATRSQFVSARRHVLARLTSVDRTAAAIADRIADDVKAGRPPVLRVPIESARKLTIDRILPLLGKLQLAHATMLLRGPDAALRDAYAAIGRRPAFLD